MPDLSEKSPATATAFPGLKRWTDAVLYSSWFESLQNWQSEFLSIVSIVGSSIFLRQKGSPESKPVDASYEQTGK